MFEALNDSNSGASAESEVFDVFEDGSLLLTVHIVPGGLAVDQHYANFSVAIPNLHTFLDDDETWTGNMELDSPASSSLFPNLTETAAATNITRSGSATYGGLAMGAMSVGGVRKLLAGASVIEVDFDNSDLELLVGLAALDSDDFDPNITDAGVDELLDNNAVFIDATGIGFGANGALTGTPEFSIDARTVGTGVPLENETATLEGGFRGPAGEVLILSGSVTDNNDVLVWGSIATEAP